LNRRVAKTVAYVQVMSAWVALGVCVFKTRGVYRTTRF
jgi:hypothetical protein